MTSTISNQIISENDEGHISSKRTHFNGNPLNSGLNNFKIAESEDNTNNEFTMKANYDDQEKKACFPPIIENGLLELSDGANFSASNQKQRSFYGKKSKIIYTRSNSDVSELHTNQRKRESNSHSSIPRKSSGSKRTFQRSLLNPGRGFGSFYQDDVRTGEIERLGSCSFSQASQYEDANCNQTQQKRWVATNQSIGVALFYCLHFCLNNQMWRKIK